MDETNKRDRPSDTETDGGGDIKRARTPATYAAADNEDDDDVASLLSVDVEAFAVLKELLASPEKVLSPPCYAAVAGNEESCGSSFSDCDSSVMASFDFVGFCGGAWDWSAARGGDDVAVVEMGGLDGWDCFDEMLARFLGEEEVCQN